MNLSAEQAAIVSDRRRLWEVRKYRKVRPAPGGNDIDAAESPAVLFGTSPASSEAALSSLLRLLVARTNVNIAIVNLLDEQTQFFLAGAQKDVDEPTTEPAK